MGQTESNSMPPPPNEDVPWAWVKCIEEKIRQTTFSSVPDLPVEILPWLFLSDEENAKNTLKLKSLGITHVLSLNGVPSNHEKWFNDLYDVGGIEHKRIHADDSESYNMIEKDWKECYSYLEKVQNTDGAKVVIHCVAGINRSGLVASAAYMIFGRVTVLEAVEACLEKRKTLLWNQSFQRQLCVLAAAENLLGPKPEGFTDEPKVLKPIPPPPRTALDRL
jgi:protein-tyrosine phosphatase